jgi:hypothetical protein
MAGHQRRKPAMSPTRSRRRCGTSSQQLPDSSGRRRTAGPARRHAVLAAGGVAAVAVLTSTLAWGIDSAAVAAPSSRDAVSASSATHELTPTGRAAPPSTPASTPASTPTPAATRTEATHAPVTGTPVTSAPATQAGVSRAATPSSTPPTSASATASARSCVPVADYPSVLTHTWDDTTAVITLAGHRPLCSTLDVQGVSWTYLTSTAIFPQLFSAESPVTTISGPGVYVVSAPPICGQTDIYAAIGHAPAHPPELTAPETPFEASFLNRYSRGPWAFHADSPQVCAPAGVSSPTVTPTVTPTITATVTPTSTPPAAGGPSPSPSTPVATTAVPTIHPTATVLPLRTTFTAAASRSGKPTASVSPLRTTNAAKGTSGGSTSPGSGRTAAVGPALPQTGGFAAGAGVVGLLLLAGGAALFGAARHRH